MNPQVMKGLRSASAEDNAGIANTLALPCLPRRVQEVCTAEEARAALATARDAGIPVLPLGAGSNVVLPPELEVVVLRSNDASIELLREGGDAVDLRVGAGHDWHALVGVSLEQDWFGLENLALIPGTVGAAPVQNIGAYGVELEQFVTAVHGIELQTGAARCLETAECAFTYRSSIFKTELRNRFFITQVDLRLSRKPAVNLSYPRLREEIEVGEYPETPHGVYQAVVDIRRSRLPDPVTNPNVGSFFENPVVSESAAQILRAAEPSAPIHAAAGGRFKLSAAWLIEAAGLRGFSLGPVGMSEQHSLVLENLGSAEQSDVLALASHVRDEVQRKFGITLRIEPRVYGADGRETTQS
jgi:UDP-N-acetylmuramate dehydrogenase